MKDTSRCLLACLLLACTHSPVLMAAEDSEEQGMPVIEVRESVTDTEEPDNYSGIKSLVPGKDLPLVVETLSARVLENVRSQNLEALLDQYSSGSASPAEGGLTTSIILRGFVDAGFYRNGLNDSLGTVPLRDVANVESIEILKGANSALYGTGEPGGTINIVTKQPSFEAEQSARVSIGSYQDYRVELDSTGPLSSKHGLAYRMISAYENAESFRDTVRSNKIFVAPSLLWSPNRHWNFLADIEYIQHKLPYDSGLLAVNNEFPLPNTRFLGEPALKKTRLQAVTTNISAEYRPVEAWGLSAKLLWQNTDIDGSRVVPDEIDDSDPDETLLVREVQREIDDADGISAQLELDGMLKTGRLEHQLLAGYEFVFANNYVELDSSDTDLAAFEIDIFDPQYGQSPPSLSSLRKSDEDIHQHSLYLQDFISFGDRFRLLLGTRLDKTDIDSKDVILATSIRQNDDELSSRVAAMYSLNSLLSLFASYGESTETNEGLTPQGNPLHPSKGESVEVGIKFRHPWADLSMDLALYSIEQTNIAVDAPGAPGFEIQTARQKSEGLDFEISFKPADWIYTKIKYAYNDAEIHDDPEIPDGTQPINTPMHKLVLSSFFSMSIREKHDLQAGVNFVYRSEQKASLDTNELNVKLPGYWVGDVFINYAVTSRISLGLNINNILDNSYLASTQVDLLHLHAGSPITVNGSVKILF